MVYSGYSKYFIIISAFLATVLSLPFLQIVEAKGDDSYLVESVKFYPYKNITLSPTDHYVMGTLTDILLTSAKSSVLKLTPFKPQSSSDYILEIDYAVGCGAYRPEKYCRIMFLWTLMRADGAPVSGWRSDYPISVTRHQAINRFYDYVPPKHIMQQATDDFIQALSSIMIENSGGNLLKSQKMAHRNKKKKSERPLKKNSAKRFIYVQKDQVSHPKAACSVKQTQDLLEQYNILTTRNLKRADYILKTKTVLQDAGGGFVGVRIERQLIDVKTGKGILIPQETAMPQHHFTRNGINCKSAVYTSIKQIKEYIYK